VKPLSSQFYNYITHWMATQAGRHDAQQGTMTAALSGSFAKTTKDQNTAAKKQSDCS